MDEKASKETQRSELKKLPTGIGVGIAIGVALGVAVDNIALGVGVGVAIGVGLGTAWSQMDASTKNNDTDMA